MAYRRKQGMSRSSTFQEETIFRSPADPKPQRISRSSTFQEDSINRPSPGDPFFSPSLAAQAIRTSAAHRDQSQADAALSNGYTSFMPSANEGGGLWGVVARKGKEILEDGNHISHLQ